MAALSSPPDTPTPRLSAAERVFGHLKTDIVALRLPPGTRLSEADVALEMDVSRQPVRDAFYRLSRLGFLTIRPQRATVVSDISEAAVLRARFIRAALEIETVRAAATTLSAGDHAALATLVAAQRAAIAAGDRQAFHRLDDEMHRQIAIRAGLGYAWDVIEDNKAHMDRVRHLTLASTSDTAHAEHVALLAALARRDAEAAAVLIRDHLGRIVDQLAALRRENRDWFAADGPDAGS